MGQDKKQLTKLLQFVKDLYDHPDNQEFAAGIQAIVLSEPKGQRDARLDEIYEYCIERNARKQASAVYSHFPLKEILDDLINNFSLMESFKRRGDFLNFSAHLFKQIEGIASHICKNESFNSAFVNLLNSPAFVSYNPGNPPSILSRKTDSMTISKLIFGDYERTKDGKEKKGIPINKQYIIDKIKISLYFGGYATCLLSSYEFSKFSYDISNIYQIRCEADHGGNERSAKQEEAFQAIMAEQDRYYIEFLKVLLFYIDKIAEGFSRWQDVFDYASNLSEVESSATISSALPGALYVRCEGQKAELVPVGAYDRSFHYENGMKVSVFKKGGVITKIQPIT